MLSKHVIRGGALLVPQCTVISCYVMPGKHQPTPALWSDLQLLKGHRTSEKLQAATHELDIACLFLLLIYACVPLGMWAVTIGAARKSTAITG